MKSQSPGLRSTNPRESKPAPYPQKKRHEIFVKVVDLKEKCTQIKQETFHTCQTRLCRTSLLITTPIKISFSPSQCATELNPNVANIREDYNLNEDGRIRNQKACVGQ